MTNELDKLRDALRSERPQDATPDARDAAMKMAMLRFEQHQAEKKLGARQGSASGERLKKQTATGAAAFLRRLFMIGSIPRLSHVLAGGVSLAAILLVVNISGINLKTGDWGDLPSLTDGPQPESEQLLEAERRAEAGSDLAAKRQALAPMQPAIPAPPSSVTATAEPESTIADALTSYDLAAEAPPVGGIARQAAPGRAPSVRMRATGGLGPAPVAGFAPDSLPVTVYREQGRDQFSNVPDNPVKRVAEEPVSTFSADIDTASYSFVRNSLNNGTLPPKDAVRIEEMINYFDYDYPLPDSREAPFRPDVEIMPTPWNAETKLMRIGIKGYEIERASAPRANLVFLIDTSGSMESPDKLPLLRQAFHLLVSSLQPDDVVSIVAYAGSAGTVLEPTKASDNGKILAALDRLAAGGSTAGGEGIRQAYQLAEQHLDKNGINRVILATDGDFNVGIQDPEQLKDFVERKRDTGVTLSVLGFGRGNYNDLLMQELAQNGNGNAAYIDTLSEARKVLVDEAGSTLFPIAKDVKFQVEFNPGRVSEYRLIGYETRQLQRQDFNNDKVDAGDIGAGHTVTALYEYLPSAASGALIEPLRYQTDGSSAPAEATLVSTDEIAFLKIRYKLPDADTSKLIEMPVTADMVRPDSAAASNDTRFAAAVAGFGEILKGGTHTGAYTLHDVQALAGMARGSDTFNYRGAFLELVRLAQSAQAMEPLKQ